MARKIPAAKTYIVVEMSDGTFDVVDQKTSKRADNGIFWKDRDHAETKARILTRVSALSYEDRVNKIVVNDGNKDY